MPTAPSIATVANSVSASTLIYNGKHNITVGGEFRKQQYNDFFEQNPRGAFGFTGAATQGAAGGSASGSDLADFLIGVPDTSAIAFGNADKYFREPVYSAVFHRRLARGARFLPSMLACGGTTARPSRNSSGGWSISMLRADSPPRPRSWAAIRLGR